MPQLRVPYIGNMPIDAMRAMLDNPKKFKKYLDEFEVAQREAKQEQEKARELMDKAGRHQAKVDDLEKRAKAQLEKLDADERDLKSRVRAFTVEKTAAWKELDEKKVSLDKHAERFKELGSRLDEQETDLKRRGTEALAVQLAAEKKLEEIEKRIAKIRTKETSLSKLQDNLNTLVAGF